MRVLITGGRGQLAHDLGQVFADQDLMMLSRGQFDICDNEQVQEVIGAARPDVVINTAAFVRVDDAEGEIAQSFAVNAGRGRAGRAGLCGRRSDVGADQYGLRVWRAASAGATDGGGSAGPAERLRRLETGRRIRGPGAVSAALHHPKLRAVRRGRGDEQEWQFCPDDAAPGAGGTVHLGRQRSALYPPRPPPTWPRRCATS